MTEIPREILPVIDLKHGQVVHAVAGQREKYQPLVSRWTPSAHDPLELSKALSTQLGLREFYVADLDAIERHDHQHTSMIQHMLDEGYALWLDAGFTDLEEMKKYIKRGVHRLILSSESLPRLSLVVEAIKSFGQDRIVFSLDFVNSELRCRDATVDNLHPEEILDNLIAWGVTQFILLDLAAVGTSQGPSLEYWCRILKSMFPASLLISGGGIRDTADIKKLIDIGVNRVLVSTWLHATNH